MTLSDLYSARILELAGNAPSAPRLTSPDGSARRRARLCGSTIEVDVTVSDGVITGYGHSVKACALGQTSAAIVARVALGTEAAEIRRVRAAMTAMLKADGPPPEGERWQDLRYLEPVRDYPARHESTLLVFDALCDALDAAEGTP
jgi:NifU-like protein involved in Fe-S cluster formation